MVRARLARAQAGVMRRWRACDAGCRGRAKRLLQKLDHQSIYIVMGWAALAVLVPLLRELGTAGFAWVAAGGSFCTVGIVFYALDTRLKHAHGVWHLFVIAGSACHYVAVLCYVL